jgi:aryl-alcohol dehydrogenase (NADP+)
MMSYGNPQHQKWYKDLDESRPFVKKAIDLGINFFDTANVYSRGRSEEITGNLLGEYSRDDYVIATKVFFPLHGYDTKGSLNKHGLSKYHIFKAIDDSLKRLNMDHVDLYQIHRLDKTLPMEDIMRALNKVIHDGKTLHIGASSMYAWQFARMLYIADKLGLERFKTMQNHYNLIYREEEREMFPLCHAENIGTIPWSPLARGFLSGKYKRSEKPTGARVESDRLIQGRYFKDSDFDVVERVVEVAKEKEVKPSQIALAWILSKEYVTSPIIGASKLEHIEDAVESLSIKLSKDDIIRLEEVYKPHPILGHS